MHKPLTTSSLTNDTFLSSLVTHGLLTARRKSGPADRPQRGGLARIRGARSNIVQSRRYRQLGVAVCIQTVCYFPGKVLNLHQRNPPPPPVGGGGPRAPEQLRAEACCRLTGAGEEPCDDLRLHTPRGAAQARTTHTNASTEARKRRVQESTMRTPRPPSRRLNASGV